MIFKDEKISKRFMYLHPMIIFIVADINNYCWNNFGKKITITSAVRTQKEDDALGAKSKTHQQGRAVDLSVKGFNADEIKQIQDIFSQKYRGYGAISSSDYKERLIVFHVGNAPHLHIQLNRNYSLDINEYALDN